MLRTVNLHKDFVNEKCISVALLLNSQSSGEFWSELFAPEPDRFVAYSDAPLRKQILNILVTEIESVVEPSCVLNDFRRK